MGTYRLVLAVMVMLAHMGTDIGGRAQGVAAVVSFFIISGFVMTATIRRNYPTLSAAPMFFVDRAMRIFPQYLLYIALTVAAFAWVGIKVPFISGITTSNVLANAFLVPTGLYSWEAFGAAWMPQGWTLGLEAKFYLVIPFLLILNFRKWAMLPSMIVFIIAYLGIIHTETWGYMSLSGTLFIFLCGSLLYDLKERFHAAILLAVYIFAMVLFYFLTKTPTLHFKWSYEVLLGLLLGLPMVALLSRKKFGHLDDHLGNISYGAYLNHSLIIFLFEAFNFGHSSWKMQLSIIACSIVMGWVSFHIVEKPIVKLRRRLRRAGREAVEMPTSSVAKG